jgi:aryl-alcohol dehydrogenase-like predicted oxidoreductase
MQFPLFHSAVCSVIPGALSAAEVKQNVARLSVVDLIRQSAALSYALADILN